MTLLAGLPAESRTHRILQDETLHWTERLALAKGQKRPRTHKSWGAVPR